ncbi:MAG: STAS/SEC14 domain-containing protein [Bacteroidota bacterium]
MIYLINTPENVVAFRATGEITQDDYKTVVVPAVEKLVNRINEINFLFVIDTEFKNFTATAWMEDMMMGLKNLGKWNRTAIVTDSDTVISFTNAFSYIVPGEFRGYKKEAFDEALNWVQGN